MLARHHLEHMLGRWVEADHRSVAPHVVVGMMIVVALRTSAAGTLAEHRSVLATLVIVHRVALVAAELVVHILEAADSEL